MHKLTVYILKSPVHGPRLVMCLHMNDTSPGGSLEFPKFPVPRGVGVRMAGQMRLHAHHSARRVPGALSLHVPPSSATTPTKKKGKSLTHLRDCCSLHHAGTSCHLSRSRMDNNNNNNRDEVDDDEAPAGQQQQCGKDGQQGQMRRERPLLDDNDVARTDNDNDGDEAPAGEKNHG